MKWEAKSSTFDDGLLNLINRSVKVGDVILTLGRARPNRITWINEDGVWVRTEKSDREGTGPQLVPAWMIAAAWNRLVQRGRLSQQELLEELNVKRSAFVCALLAHFPDVEAEKGISSSAQPIALILSANAHHVSRSMEPQTADAAFADRLNELLESNPYSTEDFADALSDEGVVMATEIATRLLAGKGGLPADSIIDAVARIFDVEPEYLLGSAVESPPAARADLLEDHDTPSEGRREYHSETRRTQFGSELAITLQEFGRIVEALSVAADRYLADPQADIALAAALARAIAALGYELGQAQAEEILITRALLEEVVLTWARTGPSDTASREDFLWVAELLGKG
jgi:transcriptional regulator with XRE-family HTH domain